MRSDIICILQFFPHSSFRNMGKVGAVPVCRIYGSVKLSCLNVTCHVTSIMPYPGPFLSGRKQLGKRRRRPLWLRMWNNKRATWLHSPPLPNIRKLQNRQSLDSGGRISAVHDIDNQKSFDRLRTIDQDHICSCLSNQLRTAFKPAPDFECQRTRCNDCCIASNPRFSRHLHRPHPRIAPLPPTLGLRGVHDNLPAFCGTGAGSTSQATPNITFSKEAAE